MRKIPTLFVRDPDNRARVIDQVTPGCEWVIEGHGQASFKWDGTCVMLDDQGNWWARREVKPDKAEPPNWVEIDPDPVTGKRMGWEPIEQSGYIKAFEEATKTVTVPWTYELVGPKINGNPHGLDHHSVIPHGAHEVSLDYIPLSYDGIGKYLQSVSQSEYFEGLVFRHRNLNDNRMCKIKTRDFAPEGV